MDCKNNKGKKIDFIGIKAHGDPTDRWYATMDIAGSILNDPYAIGMDRMNLLLSVTESDMDGALTMQIFKLLTGSPIIVGCKAL